MIDFFVSWFTSFESSAKELLHYTDGINGTKKKETLKDNFFLILEEFSKIFGTLESKNIDEASSILSAFDCKFLP